MALTSIIGNDGAITLPGGIHDGVINRWRASFASVVSETTGFGDSTIRRNRLGMLSCEGSASGLPTTGAGSSQPGVGDIVAGGSALTLTVFTGCSYVLTAAFSNITHDVNKLGESTLTFDFVNGDADALTVNWVEA